MDERSTRVLEGLFQEKVLLYNDLLHCLKSERESLINIELDRLWAISKEKEEICTKIGSIRREILSVVDPDVEENSVTLNQILELLPGTYQTSFRKLFQTLITLKGEIELLRKENMMFIDDSLQFLDEMISILTGESTSKMMYDEKCRLNKSAANVLLSREA